MKKRVLILGMLGMLFMIAVPTILPAAETAASDDPLMGAVKFGEHTAYTELIWKSGRIENIDETGIRVADLGYAFTPETKYYSATGQPLTRMNFHKGTPVKFVLKRDPVTKSLVTIVSLIKER